MNLSNLIVVFLPLLALIIPSALSCFGFQRKIVARNRLAVKRKTKTQLVLQHRKFRKTLRAKKRGRLATKNRSRFYVHKTAGDEPPLDRAPDVPDIVEYKSDKIAQEINFDNFYPDEQPDHPLDNQGPAIEAHLKGVCKTCEAEATRRVQQAKRCVSSECAFEDGMCKYLTWGVEDVIPADGVEKPKLNTGSLASLSSGSSKPKDPEVELNAAIAKAAAEAEQAAIDAAAEAAEDNPVSSLLGGGSFLGGGGILSGGTSSLTEGFQNLADEAQKLADALTTTPPVDYSYGFDEPPQLDQNGDPIPGPRKWVFASSGDYNIDAYEGNGYAAAPLDEGSNARMYTDVRFDKTYYVAFRAQIPDEGFSFKMCCDGELQGDCPESASSKDKFFEIGDEWQPMFGKCPSGTKRLVFICENISAGSDACGVDDIKLYTFDTQPYCKFADLDLATEDKANGSSINLAEELAKARAATDEGLEKVNKGLFG